MFTQTPVYDPASSTILGKAFTLHSKKFVNDKMYSVGDVETVWLNALCDTAISRSDSHLLELIGDMLELLNSPHSVGSKFKQKFRKLYKQACTRAYPLTWFIIEKHHAILGLTHDYCLQCFDLGALRAMEDEAFRDNDMKTFISSMLKIMTKKTKRPDHEVFRATFDIYSEAMVYHLLKARLGDKLRIKKIAESKQPSPDFDCELDVVSNNLVRTLKFYIEVKAFDIVNASQRYPEMLDEAMDAQIELERQKAEGRQVATTLIELSSFKPFGNNAEYSPWSIRQVIEALIDKARNNFKSSQFQNGPTFALANLTRLILPGQGASTLSPYFYQNYGGGACVSGVLWNVAFGKTGYPIYKLPHFEGGQTIDGELAYDGVLVDQNALPNAGLINLHFDDGQYRFDGLYDSHWVHRESNWSNVEVGEVIHALCDDYNTRDNERAYSYALHSPKRK